MSGHKADSLQARKASGGTNGGTEHPRNDKAPFLGLGGVNMAEAMGFEPYPVRCNIPLCLAIPLNHWLAGLKPTLFHRFNQLCFRQFFDTCAIFGLASYTVCCAGCVTTCKGTL